MIRRIEEEKPQITIDITKFNLGNAKVFKSGTGLGIIIPNNIRWSQELIAGETVEFLIRKINIPVRAAKHSQPKRPPINLERPKPENEIKPENSLLEPKVA